MFFVLTQVWDKWKKKEKILSPHGESNLRPPDSALRCSTPSHRDSTVSKVYYKVRMTHVQHTARISNVNSIMFVDRNKRDG